MSQSKSKSQSEDLFAALMDELKVHAEDDSSLVLSDDSEGKSDESSGLSGLEEDDLGLLDLNFGDADKSFPTENISHTDSEIALDFNSTDLPSADIEIPSDLSLSGNEFESIMPPDVPEGIAGSSSNELDQYLSSNNFGLETSGELPSEEPPSIEGLQDSMSAIEDYNNVLPFEQNSDKTQVLTPAGRTDYSSSSEMSDDERTVAVSGYSNLVS